MFFISTPTLDATAIDDAREHAVSEFPRESVGIIVETKRTKVQRYVRLANVHPEPEEAFSVDPAEIAKAAKGKNLRAVIHSHPGGPLHPSAADMQAQLDWHVPFGIIMSGRDSSSAPVFWGGDTPRQPLYGRPFLHGITDCYSFLRDYYAEVHGIDLPEFPRDDDWWSDEYEPDGTLIRSAQNLYLDGFEKAGFRVIDFNDLRPGDAVLMRLGGKAVNHAAVFLGGDTFAHHQLGRISEKTTGLMRYRRQIHCFLRHGSMFTDADAVSSSYTEGDAA